MTKASLAELIESLTIVSENIIAEAVRQPRLFIEAARYRVAKMRARTAAEMALEQYAGAVGLKIRAHNDGKERLTVDHIKARIQRLPRHQELQTAVHEAEAREEFAKLLLEAFRQRRDALRIISDAEHYEAARESGEAERFVQHRQLADKARELHAQRKRLVE